MKYLVFRGILKIHTLMKFEKYSVVPGQRWRSASQTCGTSCSSTFLATKSPTWYISGVVRYFMNMIIVVIIMRMMVIQWRYSLVSSPSWWSRRRAGSLWRTGRQRSGVRTNSSQKQESEDDVQGKLHHHLWSSYLFMLIIIMMNCWW